ncbi:MAG: crosslink repair DNA glycosylase YcaQ family protein [Vicinamibacterales bacterium]
MTLDGLRSFAVSRSLFKPLSLDRAIEKLGFVQADPIRSPARAQDLTLRHRVKGYRAGDLERLYAALAIEEDVLINYGFVSRRVHGLMHPRARLRLPADPRTRKDQVLAFVRDRGELHPREVDAHFSHGTVTNYWGGSSNATTHLLEHLHYRGWLRVARRESGVRVYAFREATGAAHELSPGRRVDALVDVVVTKYAPLPALSLSFAVGRLRYAVPQWRRLLKGALERARKRLAHERVDGVEWYWPEGERVRRVTDDTVRLLAPFDPVVWDRRRFELFWGWPYRFEAYTPVAKRRFGYYALPMLWRDHVIGWANVSVAGGRLMPAFGYVASTAPRDPIFKRELEAELERLRRFLGIE